MTQKNGFFFIYIWFFKHITYQRMQKSRYVKGCRKLRNGRYNLCVQSLFHIDAQVLASHFRKIVELGCFGCDSIAISEAHVTFWAFFIVPHCNIIRTYQTNKKQRKLRRQKKWAANIFWHHTHPLFHFSLLFLVNFPPPLLMRYFLNSPLEAHLEPCQTPVKLGFQARKHVRYLRTPSL